jgi:ribosomal protein S18 acetylase RimI-like enzyme
MVVALWAEIVVDSFHDRADDVRRLLVRDPDALLVAEDEGGRVVGTLIVGWDGWRGKLYRMAVATAARRKGIAAALVAEGERRLATAGCRRISAVVVRDDDAAPAFWRSAGYVPDPVAKRFVKNLE